MSAEKIMVIGVNHKTAPVEIRERLAFSNDPGTPYRELSVIPGSVSFPPAIVLRFFLFLQRLRKQSGRSEISFSTKA